jgi:hypothetical protein
MVWRVTIVELFVAIGVSTACGCSAGSGSHATIGVTGSGGASATLPGGGGANPGQAGAAVAPPADTSTFTIPPASGGMPPTMPGSTAMPVVTSGPLGPLAVDECGAMNPAGIDSATAKALMQGGAGASVRLLYPYEGTVFPKGLIAPLLMWDGPDADLVSVHLHSSLVDYRGCFKPSGPNQLQFPQAIWDQATARTGGATDPYLLEVTTSSKGTVTGPVAAHLVVAKATLKGSIYYGSYATKLLSGVAGTNGAILRIVPGKNAEIFLGMSGCTGCHSVSANGTRIVTQNLPAGGTYALTPGGATNPPALAPNAPETSFAGVFPDGSFYVTNSSQAGVGVRGAAIGLFAPGQSSVYDTTTGNPIMNTGIPSSVMTPSFSPDGTVLTFSDAAMDPGRAIAVMSFDGKMRTASNYKQVYKAAAPDYAAWPFVLPDDKGVVCAIGPTADFSGSGVGLSGTTGDASAAPRSDLFLIDVATGTSTLLARAMGFDSVDDATKGTSYLPFGAAEETHHNYYPTISPVAAGGYFWVFFDSYRHYGNLGLQRQLWASAVDVSSDGSYRIDPSHPAFYVPGQELGTGNHRAFTALDPCRADGDSCSTGIDCCNGYCTNGKCGPPPPPPDGGPRCAGTDESCTGGVACCDVRDMCIAGHCGTLIR